MSVGGAGAWACRAATQGMVDGVIGVAGKLGAPCLAVASRSDAEQSGTSQV